MIKTRIKNSGNNVVINVAAQVKSNDIYIYINIGLLNSWF